MESPLLQSQVWKTSYRHEDGNLVELFYNPALSCAVQYDRMTGYFSADALALAARGIECLIRNDGHMRLVVGCTLEEAEVQAIAEGYDLRLKVEEKLGGEPLAPPDPRARQGLEALAWMIAHGRLDVKVAIPVNPDTGRPVSAMGIYHEKVGIITDAEGARISFSGSLNETRGGWVNNRESFHVHLSWEAGREFNHVEDEVKAFDRLWENQTKTIRALDFPDAARQRLLEFLPKDDRFVTPPSEKAEKLEDAEGPEEGLAPLAESPGALTPDETRQIVGAYVLNAARMPNGIRVGEVTSAVQPWPHQVHTYKRLRDAWPFRLLLCDEVGLGKTISAGLVIRQLWLEGLARRILLLVPKAVILQWQNELYEKFNLNVPFYDGQKLVWRKAHGWQGALEKPVGRDEWHRQPLVLAGSQLMRRRDRAEELLAAEPWDLIVLDEAHHARRRAAGTPQESGPNQLLRLMRQLAGRAEALLMMTATPMQVHPVEIWDLLNLLGLPEKWDVANFLRYFDLAAGNPDHEGMQFLADLFQSVEQEYGLLNEDEVERLTPDVSRLSRKRVLSALRDKSGIPLRRLDTAGRKAALRILRGFSAARRRMSRHTRSLLRLYHEKGLLETPIARREVRDMAVELTPPERALYEAVEDYISTTYNNAAQEKRAAIGFVMTIYRRRLASSFQALRKTLTKRLSNLEPLIEEDDVSDDELADDVMELEEGEELARQGLVDEEKETIKDLLKQTAKLGTDSKARRLKTELEQARADGYESALVFTQYTDTMDYVAEYLAEQMPGVPIATFSGRGGARRDHGGSWSQCSKEEIKRAFRDGNIRLLVCTDAAGEGLNLQYCGVIVNYDLPWNPMKVEQRIGRIDRIGQANPVIRVINLAYENTVEADIYFALSRRIHLFEGVVGKLQPILSQLPKEFKQVALERVERREAARQRFQADVEMRADQAENLTFDIDEVAQETLEAPEMPLPALTLEELDAALNRRDVRPVNWEWAPLDQRSYSLSMPGAAEKVRVTTSAEVFDNHFESHAFMSPGGFLFNRMFDGQLELAEAQDGAIGRCWLVTNQTTGRSRLLLATDNGFATVTSLRSLLDGLRRVSPPCAPPAGLTDTDERLFLVC